MNTYENDDNLSVGSGGDSKSISCNKLPCPHCNKDFQAKSIFNHIKDKHFREFRKSTTNKWLDEAEAGAPLRVWWDVKNDFGEDDVIEVYACLATNKSFMTLKRAELHFKKNAGDLKKHNKEIAKLKKEIQKDKQKEKKQDEEKRLDHPYFPAFKNNDPELARCIWMEVLFDKHICSWVMCQKQLENAIERNDTMYWREMGLNKPWTPMTCQEWVEKAKSLIQEATDLENQKSLDCKLLEKLARKLYFFRKDIAVYNVAYLDELYPDSPNYFGTGIHAIDMFSIKRGLKVLDAAELAKFHSYSQVDF